MRSRTLFRVGVVTCALLAAMNLLAGLSGGLARLGWAVPAAAIGTHGAVMACGFFGTLIALERAVALQRGWGLAAPLAAGAGGVAVWALGSPDLGALSWGLAALLLVALYGVAGITRAWSLHLRVELAAAIAWALGTMAWRQNDLTAATLGWMAFLVGTIAGERRELMQFVRLPDTAQRTFLAMMAIGGAAVLVVVKAPTDVAALAPLWLGPALWWLACAALATWLLSWDIAPRQWRREGWIGHTGVCLTVGYGWLLVGAVLGLLGLVRPAGAAAMAPHAVLLGFVFAMVFGHAPIMLPALARLRPRYTPWVRLPIWVLAASLLLRLAALETRSASLLAWAGAGHGLAIGLFAAIMFNAVWGGRNRGTGRIAR